MRILYRQSNTVGKSYFKIDVTLKSRTPHPKKKIINGKKFARRVSNIWTVSFLQI